MANEYLAVYLAINIIEQYREDEVENGRDYKLVFPETYHEDDFEKCAYLDNLLKGLYYVKPKYIDIFAYSNIFFFIEKYTDTVINE